MNLKSAPVSLFALVLAASVASTIGGLPFNILPLMLGSLADSFALPSDQIGLLGSICFAGYLIGTLGAPIWINRLNWRLLTVIGTLCTALSFALSAQTQTVQALYVVWAMIGFFASTMTCLGMRVLVDLPNKERSYGVRLGVELSIVAAALFALPLVIAQAQYSGAALALAALVVVLGVSARWIPSAPASDNEVAMPSTQSGLRIPLRAWLAVIVFWIFLTGNIALWAFLERIGASLQLTPAEIGIVFAVLKLLGGVAAFAIAGIGASLKQSVAYWAVLLVIGIGVVLIGSATGFVPYALGTWIWEFAFVCGCVLQTANIARCDASGRAILLVPAAFALASMVGPGLAGWMISAQGYTSVLVLALACSAVPVIALWFNRAENNS